jgi:hypothetical protein
MEDLIYYPHCNMLQYPDKTKFKNHYSGIRINNIFKTIDRI